MKQNLAYDRNAGGRKVSASMAAEILSCSVPYIYRLIEQGKLKAIRLGTRKGLRISIKSINKFLAANAVEQNKITDEDQASAVK